MLVRIAGSITIYVPGKYKQITTQFAHFRKTTTKTATTIATGNKKRKSAEKCAAAN